MKIGMLILFYILCAEAFVYFLSRNGNPEGKSIDIIMVLGANGSLHSQLTRDRVSNAAIAKAQFPEAKLLLTGNELRGEITTFKNLLAEHGYSEYIIETESTSTWENFKFSKILLATLSTNKNKILIITSEYHQERALAMARCQGLEAYISGKDTKPYKNAYLFFLKERISIARYFPQMLFSYLKLLF
jgi:uncharacterized SAM-binding protein YcdF (DUF218 family)